MITILGTNTQQQFITNSYNFVWCNQVEAYHQTLNPAVIYSDDENNVRDIKDTFAIEIEADNYAILKYEGPNYIPLVRDELARVNNA